MPADVFEGPLVNAGATLNNSVNPFDGPNISYQGSVFLDPRSSPINKDTLRAGAVPSFWHEPSITVIDAIPSAATTTVLAAAQVATGGVAMALASTVVNGQAANSLSAAYGTPLIPAGTTVVTTVVALDFGFATGTTVAASSTVVVTDSTQFGVGGWYFMPGVGNAAKTAGLFTNVQSIVNATTITVLPAPVSAISNVGIGRANLFDVSLLPPATQFTPSAVPVSVSPYHPAGLALIFDARQGVTRNLSVTASASTGGTSAILITGFDIFGQLMTELLTASGTTTVYGKKAFKYVLNAVPATTGAASYTLGVGDAFGFAVRADKWEYSAYSYAGVSAGNSNGFTAAVLTSPNTNTTGDVRGTVQISTGGVLATSAFGVATNGTSRLYVEFDVPMFNGIGGTPINPVPMFGVTNSTT